MTTITRARPWWHFSSLWPLIYLGGMVFQPIYEPDADLLDWVVVVAVVVGYSAIYLVAQRRPGRFRQLSPHISVALGLLVIPVNAYGSILFVYAASLAGSHLPRRVAIRWMVVLTVVLAAVAVIHPIPFPYTIYAFGPSMLFLWVVGLSCIDAADKRLADTAQRAENARVEHLATLSERERISRDLHDLLGQTLTGIVVRSQLAQRLTRVDTEAGVAEMAEVERAARAALTEVRATVAGWRHVDLDDELAVARESLTAAGVSLTLTREPDLVLTPSAETTLGLALREAVTNVVRHAHARRCMVELRRADGRVVLEVTDDGVGGGPVEGTGLTGMRERIAALGGQVERRTHHGTSLAVTVPESVAT